MKKIVTLICTSIFIVPIISQAQTNYPSGVPGCVGRWTFDSPNGTSLSSIIDESGNNNHGVNYNITSAEGWKGLPNTAGAFNGTNSWAEVAHHATLNCPSTVTMISLIKFNDFNNQECQFSQILSKGYPHFISGNYGFGAGDSYADDDCYVYTPSNTQMFSQIGLSTALVHPGPGNFIDLNKWYFFASSISPKGVKDYLVFMDPNNKETEIFPIDSLVGNINIGNNMQNISIGKSLNPAFWYYVNGVMDEVVLFNRALSSREIYSVYDYMYGSTTSIAENGINKNKFSVRAKEGQCIITTESSNFSYEIYNSIGQLVAKKSNNKNSQIIDLKNQSEQLLFVKILDEKNQLYSYKINVLH